MVGAVIGAAVSIGTSLIGASSQKSAAKKAASQQQAAADRDIQQQQQQYNQAREDQAPFLDAGRQAQYNLAYLMGNIPEGMTREQLDTTANKNLGEFGYLSKSFDGNYQADPAFQRRLEEGQKAIERSAAARGGLLSGATQKALNEFAQSVASDEYAQAYNRYVTEQTNLYNSLAAQAGLGSRTAELLTTSGQNTANQIGDYTTQSGNAQAAGTVSAANAWQSGLSGAGSTLSNFFKSKEFAKWLG